MSLLAIRCTRINYYTKLLCTPVLSQATNRYAAYDSKKFPGFKIIYSLDNISAVSILNRLKYRMTVFSAIVLPGAYALQYMNKIPQEKALGFAFLTFTFTLFFHGAGAFCNNVIGFIYTKDSTEEAKISYVNYWGKRMDVDGKYSDIKIKDSRNFLMKSHFQTMTIDSYEKSLKFYVQGKILDDKLFDKLCGINFVNK